eukprot:TRINITY_DN10046_c0_g1_i1.p1 TRINITY_DN10046_c0_g1~~TRINITY_DN10046_c0_g1_i1.p1  ORF type:complete len:256 (+),score=67.18 TRINITY_DN10046_c0_g1_i1:57-824(+)
MEHPLEHYKCLAEFFCRPLKQGLRPIADQIMVSPVDGRVTHYGTVGVDGTLEQIKGSSYSLSRFLGFTPHAALQLPSQGDSAPAPSSDKQLYFCVLYLAPGDYHRIHSSVDWQIRSRQHFPGQCLPVAPAFLQSVPRVFEENERVVLSGKWQHGFYSLTSVAAYNVGSIKVAFDPEVSTNLSHQTHSNPHPYGPNSSGYFKKYDQPIHAARGLELARFELGSTVVLVFEAPKNFQFQVPFGSKVRMGQELGGLSK